MKHLGFLTQVIFAMSIACAVPLEAASAKASVRVRAHNLVVNPSTGPVTYISVENRQDITFNGVLKAQFPDGWKVTQSQHKVALPPHKTQKFPFAIEQATEDLTHNRYPITITIEGTGQAITCKQDVVWTSAPYYKPVIDGKAKEWADAVPITFETEGKKTVVRLYWNKKQFCLLIEVEEDALIGLKKNSPGTGMDAVQFAISPAGSVTGTRTEGLSNRCEFLAADSGKRFGSDKCFQLMAPNDALGIAKKTPPLNSLLLEDAQTVVKRSGHITTYEIAVPFKQIPGLKPTAGREYCFSLLVHDPDGTGIRDLGTIMNLTESQRKEYGWCSWEHVKWGSIVPYDNKVEFGFCSSIH